MTNLYTAENNLTYIVEKTPNMSILTSLGVFEGSKITKKNTYKLGGPVLILIEGREVAIGKDLAREISVTKENI